MKKSKNAKEVEESNIKKVPLLSLKDIVIFPYSLTPLLITNPKDIKMLDEVNQGNRLISIFSDIVGESSAQDDIFLNEVNLSDVLKYGHKINDKKKILPIGVLARIIKILKFPDGTVRVLIRGLNRVQCVQFIDNKKYDTVIVQEVERKEDPKDIETTALARNVIMQFDEMTKYLPNYPQDLKMAIMDTKDSLRAVDMIVDSIHFSYIEKLNFLMIQEVKFSLQLVTILLNRELELLKLGSKIQSQVQGVMSKTQRDFFLREQLKAIKKELGDEEEKNTDCQIFREKMKDINFTEEVKEVLEKELHRLEMVHKASGEYQTIYDYIDWLISIPWKKYSNDNKGIQEAEKILNKDHYGLDDIKDRILDFIAVLQLKKDKKSPILCFVGPPGVGKTSLGKSIARAMGREFARFSLGGVRDEAEIRGHRKTYIGAMPGRIIRAMKKAKTSNPVIMLDEIDKLGSDFKGDPSSALLEVLDSQQNNQFNDHYIEVDYDLSSVMFIATANILDTIPPALRDRMEIIRIPGYTATEKKQIANKYLVPRQLKENGVLVRQLSFRMSAIDEIIHFYTREAGVRLLEKTINKVCRKVARGLVSEKYKPEKRIQLAGKDIKEFLGTRKYLMDEAEASDDIGIAIGMAWTSVGGAILPLEVTLMPGKGALQLTGSLGDVMKESAQIAFSYVKSQSKKFKISADIFQKNDFHIHVPDGATPKDGPSAGITITIALLSLLTKRKVKEYTSMTGEITLRGKITPIGGVKEKVIAALCSGIKTIILPEKNRKDLEEIPNEVQKKLEILFVKHISEAVKILFN